MALAHPDRGTYENWFRNYVQAFRSGSEADQRNLSLKEEHTWRVQADALAVAGGLGLDRPERELAAVIALFHDVGRFPQYHRYRTFRDSDSVNHAALGARVLLEQQVLRDLARADRDLVVRAVTLHNVFSLPPGLDRRLSMHARIVRDADKLDIWRIFAELYALPADQRPSAAGLGLPETPDCSAAVLDRLLRGEMVPLQELRTLNDFKLLQLSWIYDLNFRPAFELVRQRRIIGRLASTLPDSESVRTARTSLEAYVAKHQGS